LTNPYTSFKDTGDTGTLVIISLPPASNPDADEISAVEKWVQAGGLLIIIDREIQLEFPGNIQVRTSPAYTSSPVRPLQPTRLAKGVRRLPGPNPTSYVTVSGSSTTGHIGGNLGALIAETKLVRGRVVLITKPNVVSKIGMEEDDNRTLARTWPENRPAGKIAFDEYHHGYGTGSLLGGNGILGYFRGTPVPWILAQAILISLLLIYT